ncbi:hypothetical protein BdWA1_000889 [Babesia duncani]|uniref:Uncharacterized protein n=1 Tax=Babesia duncani TaxID=323732 RepID=A0AAD9PNM7_9APIC|nr:hypothetical protein BdWA1_003692 [Babesia duncani]KAK2197886.1 hypothetical protein BdWA1_000889 [Babesia duncani]
MLNLLPLRNPAVSLLYGKTGLQRIRVGKEQHVLEVDRKLIDEVYAHARDDVILHNDYIPLKHRNYMEYKLIAYHLIEAFENPERSHKTTLSGITFIDKLCDLYLSKMVQTQAHVLQETSNMHFSFPIQGKNI